MLFLALKNIQMVKITPPQDPTIIYIKLFLQKIFHSFRLGDNPPTPQPYLVNPGQGHAETFIESWF